VKQAAVGFCAHSGWSAVVAVSLVKGSPAVLHRERVHLVEEFTYRLRQPYHTAEKMAPADGGKFIAKARTAAGILALRALRALQAQLQPRGYNLSRGALLLASGKPLPVVEKILASHALIHTADGELFREALTEACERSGMSLFRVREKELLKQAAQRLGTTEAVLLQQAKELGRPFGSPWSRDEKFAALAAWLALVSNEKGAQSL
jgi:hypothetical protein